MELRQALAHTIDYDKIVPARIAEITKKLGAPVKVEPHKIDTQDGEKDAAFNQGNAGIEGCREARNACV
jgi:ABC-type transport system substrate-binding protein